jgi:hypothetical protein
MAARKTTTIEVPTKYRKKYNTASFSIASDGHGTVTGIDGSTIATFLIQQSVKRTNSFHFERTDAKPITAKYKVLRDDLGAVTVSGKCNGEPFNVMVSGYGKLIEGKTPSAVKTADKRLFAAMAVAFEARAQQHFDKAGCALAGIEVIVSAFALHPLGVAFGFVGILVACS